MTTPMMTGIEQNLTNSQTDIVTLIQDTERAKLVQQWAQKTYTAMKQQRSRVERMWYLNLAFYRGRQNIAFINTPASLNGFRLLTPPAVPWRVRLVINRIRPIIRREIAKLTSQKPAFVVVPASNEDEDYYAAKVGEQILESAYSDCNIEEVNHSRTWWNSICGTSFIKCYWDKNKIVKEKGPVDQMTGKATDIQGDICVENITPFHVLVPDLMEYNIENQPYVFHVFTKSKTWIQTYYGTEVASKATVKVADGDLLEDSFFDVSGLRQPIEEQYLCMEIWIKPGGHKMFPKGGVVTIVGDQLIQVQETYPYSHGQYPFIKFESIFSGQFYGHSVIEDLISLQRELNRTRSQIVEAKNLMAKPKLMGPRGSINPNKITSEPGQFIPYEPGLTPPTPLPMQNLPPFVSEEVQRLMNDMDDISGQHEISRGNTPSQVTAATAISFLQEQDDTMLADPLSSIERGFKKLGSQYLSFAIDFWSQERLIKVAGKDQSFDAIYLKGSKLRGNTDVRIESGSALPSSKAARTALLMDLFKMGVFAQNPSEFLRIMDLKGIEKVLEDYKVDISQAQRENIKLAMGALVNINDFDNHQLHLEFHNRYSKTQEYEMLDPKIQQLFMQHRAQHQQALVVNQSFAAKQQQIMGMVQGQSGQQQPPQGGINGQ